MKSSTHKKALYHSWYDLAFTYHPLPGGIKPKIGGKEITKFNSTMRWIRDKYPKLNDSDFKLAMHYMFVHNPLFLDSTREYLNLELNFCRVLHYYVAWKNNNKIDPTNPDTWKEVLMREKPEYEVFLMSLLDE